LFIGPNWKSAMHHRRSFWKPFAAAFVLSMVAGSIGAASTDLGRWYQTLRKPAWEPPDAVFPPAWSTMFTLAAVSAALAWRNAPDSEGRRTVASLFAGNAFLNVLWSFLFFRAKRPDWALIEWVFLLGSVVAPMIVLRRYSKTASWLLLPYLAWVSFAGVLNRAIIRLNPPGGRVPRGRIGAKGRDPERDRYAGRHQGH
jgi:translocator protein